MSFRGFLRFTIECLIFLRCSVKSAESKVYERSLRTLFLWKEEVMSSGWSHAFFRVYVECNIVNLMRSLCLLWRSFYLQYCSENSVYIQNRKSRSIIWVNITKSCLSDQIKQINFPLTLILNALSRCYVVRNRYWSIPHIFNDLTSNR